MILYIGNYLNDEIIQERGIHFHNAAGSNRMMRIASSLVLNNLNIEILSPANSLLAKPKTKKACRSKEININNIKVFFAQTSRLPVINLIRSTISIIRRIRYYNKQDKNINIIIYNFSPELVLISLYIRILTKALIINNIEDVSIPKLIDWSPDVEVRPVQQVIFYLCMKIIAGLADRFILPTVKFIKYLPTDKKPATIITGCAEIPNNINFKSTIPLKILFSGKIEFEHGINLLIDAVKKLDKNESSKIQVNICGDGTKTAWLKNELLNSKLNFVQYKGFMPNEAYNSLLTKSDICLVLQNPEGRYKNLKIPSKLYEYYSNGKCIITSNVGDLEELPENTFSLLEQYNPEKLLEILKRYIFDIGLVEKTKESAYNFARNNFEYKIVGGKIISTLDIK